MSNNQDITSTTQNIDDSKLLNNLQYRDPSDAIDITKLNNYQSTSTSKSTVKQNVDSPVNDDNPLQSILKPLESLISSDNKLTLMGYSIPIKTVYLIIVVMVIACGLYFLDKKMNKDKDKETEAKEE